MMLLNILYRLVFSNCNQLQPDCSLYAVVLTLFIAVVVLPMLERRIPHSKFCWSLTSSLVRKCVSFRKVVINSSIREASRRKRILKSKYIGAEYRQQQKEIKMQSLEMVASYTLAFFSRGNLNAIKVWPKNTSYVL